jgi:hypothetical protein
MLPFETDCVKTIIEEAFRDEKDDSLLCRTMVSESPRKKVGYLYVAMSYRVIKSVLPAIHKIAVEKNRVLYDAEMQQEVFRVTILQRISAYDFSQSCQHKHYRGCVKPLEEC